MRQLQSSLSSAFSFDLHEGYRVTSVTVNGTIFGALDPGIPPAPEPSDTTTDGVVSNPFSITLGHLTAPGVSTTLDAAAFDSVDGDRPVLVGSDKVFDDDFTLWLATSFKLTTVSGGYYDYFSPHDFYLQEYLSTATIGIHDLVMTVQVSQVPEPATWAMLAAGFGLLSVTARSRRNA
jgi:hypothetical protein